MRLLLTCGALAIAATFVWASGALSIQSADVVHLCITPGGHVKAGDACTANDTAFDAVSEGAVGALQHEVDNLTERVVTRLAWCGGGRRPLAARCRRVEEANFLSWVVRRGMGGRVVAVGTRDTG
jgi:hypothetical protein